jgi:hypothetical protein
VAEQAPVAGGAGVVGDAVGEVLTGGVTGGVVTGGVLVPPKATSLQK